VEAGEQGEKGVSAVTGIIGEEIIIQVICGDNIIWDETITLGIDDITKIITAVVMADCLLLAKEI